MENKYTDQQTQVLDYMISHPFITSRIGIVALGVMDLRKRISELRRMGFAIADRTVTARNRNGKLVSYKEYYLEKGDNDVRVSTAEGR